MTSQLPGKCQMNRSDCPGWPSSFHAAHIVATAAGIPVEELAVQDDVIARYRTPWWVSDEWPAEPESVLRTLDGDR